MTRDVAVIRRDEEVHELERLFVERKIHGAPVVDHDGRLVGVVSQTDLINWHYETGVDGSTFYETAEIRVAEQDDLGRLSLTDIRTARIEEVMSGVTHVVGPDDAVGYAAARMMELGVHRLVVVDGSGSVMGVVSAVDLLRFVPGVEDRG
jgi:CBS-domain-containing membrane protein